MFRRTTTLLALIAGFVLSSRAVHAQQAGPVIHLDETGLFITVDEPGSNLRLFVFYDGNPGDFLRVLSDGRVALEFQTNDALLLLVDKTTGYILLGGPGTATLSETDICDFGANLCFPDGERTVMHVQGELALAPGAPPVVDITVQQVVLQQVERLFRFDIKPK